MDPYIDLTGRVTGYAVVDLRAMGTYDWRVADTNVWKVERMLLDYPHRRIALSDRRVNRLRAWYRAFRKANPVSVTWPPSSPRMTCPRAHSESAMATPSLPAKWS